MMQPWERPARGALADQAARSLGTLPVIDTARLRLRPARIDDFDTYRAIYGSPRWFHDEIVTDEEIWLDFCQLVAGWLLRGIGLMGIESRDGAGPLLGFVLINHEYGDPEAELGWMLTGEAEGAGLATEAAAALRAHGEALGLTGLVSYIAPGNDRSIRVAERLGASRDIAAEAALGDDGTLVYRHPARAPEARP